VIFNSIYNKIKNNFDDKNEKWMVNMNMYEPTFEGSDDFIRNEFKNYFYEFFINLSLSVQISNNMGDDIIHLNSPKDDNSENADPDTDEDEDKNYKHEKIFKQNYNSNPIPSTNMPQINNISSESYKNSKNKKKELDKYKNKAVKKVLSGYNIEFICNWLNTLNFKFWISSHDQSLCLRSYFVKQASNITICYDNGDVYTGSLSRGKKNGFGVLNEYFSGFVYNGFWEEDMVKHHFYFLEIWLRVYDIL
jgi:hypothetical protein